MGIVQDNGPHTNRRPGSAAHAKLAVAVKKRPVRGHHDVLPVDKVVGQWLTCLIRHCSDPQSPGFLQRLAHQLTVWRQKQHRFVAFVQRGLRHPQADQGPAATRLQLGNGIALAATLKPSIQHLSLGGVQIVDTRRLRPAPKNLQGFDWRSLLLLRTKLTKIDHCITTYTNKALHTTAPPAQAAAERAMSDAAKRPRCPDAAHPARAKPPRLRSEERRV